MSFAMWCSYMQRRLLLIGALVLQIAARAAYAFAGVLPIECGTMQGCSTRVVLIGGSLVTVLLLLVAIYRRLRAALWSLADFSVLLLSLLQAGITLLHYLYWGNGVLVATVRTLKILQTLVLTWMFLVQIVGSQWQRRCSHVTCGAICCQVMLLYLSLLVIAPPSDVLCSDVLTTVVSTAWFAVSVVVLLLGFGFLLNDGVSSVAAPGSAVGALQFPAAKSLPNVGKPALLLTSACPSSENMTRDESQAAYLAAPPVFARPADYTVPFDSSNPQARSTDCHNNHVKPKCSLDLLQYPGFPIPCDSRATASSTADTTWISSSHHLERQHASAVLGIRPLTVVPLNWTEIQAGGLLLPPPTGNPDEPDAPFGLVPQSDRPPAHPPDIPAPARKPLGPCSSRFPTAEPRANRRMRQHRARRQLVSNRTAFLPFPSTPYAEFSTECGYAAPPATCLTPRWGHHGARELSLAPDQVSDSFEFVYTGFSRRRRRRGVPNPSRTSRGPQCRPRRRYRGCALPLTVPSASSMCFLGEPRRRLHPRRRPTFTTTAAAPSTDDSAYCSVCCGAESLTSCSDTRGRSDDHCCQVPTVLPTPSLEHNSSDPWERPAASRGIHFSSHTDRSDVFYDRCDGSRRAGGAATLESPSLLGGAGSNRLSGAGTNCSPTLDEADRHNCNSRSNHVAIGVAPAMALQVSNGPSAGSATAPPGTTRSDVVIQSHRGPTLWLQATNDNGYPPGSPNQYEVGDNATCYDSNPGSSWTLVQTYGEQHQQEQKLNLLHPRMDSAVAIHRSDHSVGGACAEREYPNGVRSRSWSSSDGGVATGLQRSVRRGGGERRAAYLMRLLRQLIPRRVRAAAAELSAPPALRRKDSGPPPVGGPLWVQSEALGRSITSAQRRSCMMGGTWRSPPQPSCGADAAALGATTLATAASTPAGNLKAADLASLSHAFPTAARTSRAPCNRQTKQFRATGARRYSWWAFGTEDPSSSAGVALPSSSIESAAFVCTPVEPSFLPFLVASRSPAERPLHWSEAYSNIRRKRNLLFSLIAVETFTSGVTMVWDLMFLKFLHDSELCSDFVEGVQFWKIVLYILSQTIALLVPHWIVFFVFFWVDRERFKPFSPGWDVDMVARGTSSDEPHSWSLRGSSAAPAPILDDSVTPESFQDQFALAAAATTAAALAEFSCTSRSSVASKGSLGGAATESVDYWSAFWSTLGGGTVTYPFHQHKLT